MIRAAFLIGSVLAALAPAGCGKKEQPRPQGPNVLLVTLDTTRADRLGMYGYAQAQTPALDALASRGMIFNDAQAEVPLTLPSHTTILTGRYPRETGVRVNNQNALGTDHPTLASIFREKGYKTAAFVATFVLDSRFGLDRGFDVYDDEMVNASMDVQPLEWEQPAGVIVDRSLAWLDAHKDHPWFCWVHFYDPHDPHRPPAPFPQTYDGEIAYTDTQFRRLVDWLASTGQMDRTLVVVVGDHGESFGEHDEEGHGTFLYNVTQHVPMFFVHPTLVAGGKRVAGPVGIIDIFPTILDVMGWSKPAGILSQSFASTLKTGVLDPREVYSESNYIWHACGFAEQRSLVTAEWRYISSTRPELYDRKSDPPEIRNLLDERRDIAGELAAKLSARYAAMIPSKPAQLRSDEHARRIAEAFGYVGGGTRESDAFLTKGLPDPKDKMHVVRQFKTARRLMNEEKFDQALPLLQNAVAEAPDALAFQGALGNVLVRLKEYEKALIPLKKALELDHTFQPAWVTMGDALVGLERFDDALTHYRAAVENDPRDAAAYVKCGQVLARIDRKHEAVAEYRKAIETARDFHDAHLELGIILAELGDADGALREYRAAVRIKPDHPTSNYNLGVVLAERGEFLQAENHFRVTLAKEPAHGDALINLGICLLKEGKNAEGREALEKAATIEGKAPEANYNLAIAAARDRDYERAVELYEKVIAQRPEHPTAAEELARYYVSVRRIPDAVRILRAGQKAAPDNLRVALQLASILATSRDDSVRDAAEARRIAAYVNDRSGRAQPSVLQVVAQAEAESGEFDAAIRTARLALQNIPAGQPGAGELRSALEREIGEYENRRPIRSERF